MLRPVASSGMADSARRSDPVMRFSPLLDRADYRNPSVFRPENLLRESRRQKGISPGAVPRICVFDPDGDIVDYVRSERGAARSPHWACYHTDMWQWGEDGVTYGVVGHAVGGAFAVLVAEQMFVSGCELMIGVISAGCISDTTQLSRHMLIERSLRDEGTSHHYLPPAPYAEPDRALLDLARDALGAAGCDVAQGATWTTDAPFRETEAAIARRKAEGLQAVEMEAAALYAFATARARPVLCIAHVTNQLGCVEGDFEKGAHNGAHSSLSLIKVLSSAWFDAVGRR
jgi:uridine phosphorylase